jgi:hypothetical protein
VVEKGASGSSKKSAVFKGTGYRLGQSDNDTQGNFKALFPDYNDSYILC